MKRIWCKLLSAALLTCVLLCLPGFRAYALLTGNSETLVNHLVPGGPTEPDIAIIEDLSQGKKVQVKNTGNTPVMVSVYLSVYYQSNTNPSAILPVNGFVFDKGNEGADAWLWNGNGAVWQQVLLPGALTDSLINNVTAPSAPDGYHLEVEVIAQNRPVPENAD